MQTFNVINAVGRNVKVCVPDVSYTVFAVVKGAWEPAGDLPATVFLRDGVDFCPVMFERN